jgi:hypothetical protein
VFFVFFVGGERIVGIEAFSQKLKQNFNLYAQFNIDRGANETRFIYITGFESNMGEKLMNTPAKYFAFFKDTSCFTDQITILL